VTGAGSGEFAVAVEDSFQTLPDVPTWKELGESQTAGDATLDRQLIGVDQANDPRGNASVEGNRVGTFSLSFTYAGTNWHDLVFPASSPVGLAQSGAFAPTATIYLSADLPGNTTDEERFLSGAHVTSFSLTYTEGDVVTVDLTFQYYDEPEVGGTYADAPDPGSIERVDKPQIVTANGFDLDVAGAQVERLQEVTIEVGNMSVPRNQQSQEPADVVVGAYDQTGSITAILSNNLRELTYGSSTAVEPVDQVDETTATVTCEARNGDTDEYNVTRVQPATTSWANALSSDEQTTNPTDIRFVDITVTP
jgi:hypothetical protein